MSTIPQTQTCNQLKVRLLLQIPRSIGTDACD